MIRTALLLLLAVMLRAAPAPPLQGKITGGFQAPTTVDPQGRRSIVKGTNAIPQGNNVYLITEPQVTSYNPDDTPEMYINAERCLYDLQSGVAASDSRLAMRTADNRFALRGAGWRWDPRSSYLAISNEVVALVEKGAIQGSLTNRTTGGTNQPVRITAQRFQQDGEDAAFIGDVVVHDGPDRLRCARLNLRFAKPGGLQRIEAVQDVELTQGETEVRSGQAVYELAAGTLTITRDPVWTAGRRSGSAELLVLNRADQTLRAEGKVFMKLPLTNSVAGNSATSAPGTNRFAEIRSDHFVFREADSNRVAGAVYRGNVRVTHEQGTIRCAELAAGFDREERLEKLDATGGVEIESGGRRAFGETAQYDLAQEKISLNGHPNWEMEGRAGKSEVVVFYPKTQEVFALGKVEMEMPAGSGNALRLPGMKAQDAPGTNQTMRITSSMFSHQGEVSVFNEEVRVADGRGEIECRLLTVVTGASNQVARIVADGGVRLTQKDLTATGERAEYDVRTGLVELTGHPELSAPGKQLRSREFVINRVANTFSVAPGDYRIELQVERKGRRAAAP